ncbi:hypothetical protein EG328_000441 [Venturia inaequalis]|uniref:Uncharacterized protein n=1 Tax=Venturia inaequalis TaxID=5025 RepID=A0A8H3UZG8_VENIN|nr:hypothetical protein EG328_000441 [Venturia inaequalis]
MKTTTTTLSTLLSSALLTTAQLSYDPSTQSLKCALQNGTYCLGDSLSQPYIAHCNAGVATISCCTSSLSSLPPLGLKQTALCFQSSSTTGDASCALNGTIYTPKGPVTLTAAAKPTDSVPEIGNTTETSSKGCACRNGTDSLAPAGPSGSSIIPPVSLPSETPAAAPIVPSPSTPAAPIIPSTPSLPAPLASAPLPPIHPTAPASGAYQAPSISPTGTGIFPTTPTPTTGASSFSYAIGKPTPSSAGVRPVQTTNDAGRRVVPVAVLGVVGAVAMLL